MRTKANLADGMDDVNEVNWKPAGWMNRLERAGTCRMGDGGCQRNKWPRTAPKPHILP